MRRDPPRSPLRFVVIATVLGLRVFDHVEGRYVTGGYSTLGHAVRDADARNGRWWRESLSISVRRGPSTKGGKR